MPYTYRNPNPNPNPGTKMSSSVKQRTQGLHSCASPVAVSSRVHTRAGHRHAEEYFSVTVPCFNTNSLQHQTHNVLLRSSAGLQLHVAVQPHLHLLRPVTCATMRGTPGNAQGLALYLASNTPS